MHLLFLHLLKTVPIILWEIETVLKWLVKKGISFKKAKKVPFPSPVLIWEIFGSTLEIGLDTSFWNDLRVNIFWPEFLKEFVHLKLSNIDIFTFFGSLLHTKPAGIQERERGMASLKKYTHTSSTYTAYQYYNQCRNTSQLVEKDESLIFHTQPERLDKIEDVYIYFFFLL